MLNPMCACSDSEWLRGQKILTFHAWIIRQNSLIYLFSSGLAVQQQSLTGFQGYINTVHLRKHKPIPQTNIHDYRRDSNYRISFESKIILSSVVLLFFLLLFVTAMEPRRYQSSALRTYCIHTQMNFLSIFRGADGNANLFKLLSNTVL